MSGVRSDGELPLGQYATIGDGRSVALVGADSSIDWWCVPHMDSTPLFDRLLNPENGGRFSVTPVGPFKVARACRPDSSVLEQTFTTPSETARVTDSLNSGISGRLPWSELARRERVVEFKIKGRPGHRLGVDAKNLFCSSSRIPNSLTVENELEFAMRLRRIVFVATIFLSTAAFNGSFAESSTVSEQGFDWIFFAIVGIPFIMALVSLVKPDMLEGFIRQPIARIPPR